MHDDAEPPYKQKFNELIENANIKKKVNSFPFPVFTGLLKKPPVDLWLRVQDMLSELHR